MPASLPKWCRGGSTKVDDPGLGAYIARMTDAGDFPAIALGIAMMSFLVCTNRLIWRPIYAFAERRTRLDRGPRVEGLHDPVQPLADGQTTAAACSSLEVPVKDAFTMGSLPRLNLPNEDYLQSGGSPLTKPP